MSPNHHCPGCGVLMHSNRVDNVCGRCQFWDKAPRRPRPRPVPTGPHIKVLHA